MVKKINILQKTIQLLFVVLFLSANSIYAQDTTKINVNPIKKDTSLINPQNNYSFNNKIFFPDNLKINEVSPIKKPNSFETTIIREKYRSPGTIAEWKNGTIFMGCNRNIYLGLMDFQSSSANFIYNWKNLSFQASTFANYYFLNNSYKSQFGVNASINYYINNNFSITAFGQYANNPFFHSMAAYPYIQTSNFGGYITFHGENAGLSLGARREFNPFQNRWNTQPIVMPYVKIKGIKLEMDVGPILNEMAQNLIKKSSGKKGPGKMPLGKGAPRR